MKRLPPLVLFAWFVFALAWFLPVVKGGHTLNDGALPGWQAFTAALDLAGDDWTTWSGTIARMSALTNFLMLGSILLLLRRSVEQRPGWLPVAFDVATVINLWWVTTGDRSDLRIGYWLWMGSFALMAVALHVSGRKAQV